MILLQRRTSSYVSIVYISFTINKIFLNSMKSLSSIASKQSAKETRGGRNPPMLICNHSWMHSTPTTSEPFLIMTKNTIFVTSLSTFRTLRRKCIQPFITIWKNISSYASFGSSTWPQQSTRRIWQRTRPKRNAKSSRARCSKTMSLSYPIGTRIGMQRIEHTAYPAVGKRAFSTIRKQIQVDTWFTACIWIGAWRSKDLGSSSHLVFVQASCHITQLLTLRLWSHSLQKKEKRQRC